MLEQAIRYILRDRPKEKVTEIVRRLTPYLSVDNQLVKEQLNWVSTDIAILEMCSELPFLNVDKEIGKIDFVEYKTDVMPETSLEYGMRAFEMIADGVTDDVELGMKYAETDDPTNCKRLARSYRPGLEVFSLITRKREITPLGIKYLETSDIGWVREGILRQPLMKLYLRLIDKLCGIGDSKVLTKCLFEINKLFIVSSTDGTPIKDSVNNERLGAILEWFIQTGLLNDKYEPNPVGVLLYKKRIDWSVFEDGLHIPLRYHDSFHEVNQEVLKRGHSERATCLIDEELHNISLMNSNRKGVLSDTIHIRYDSNKVVRAEMKKRFSVSYQYIESERTRLKELGKERPPVNVPDEIAEYLYIYSNGEEYQYIFKFISHENPLDKFKPKIKVKKRKKIELEDEFIYDMTDEEFKRYLAKNYGNDDAGYTIAKGLIRRRKHRNNLVKELKEHYHNCCQICETSFKDEYGVDYSEGHHIEGFAETKNHRPGNIVILCPNHHRVIHKAGATFDHEKKAFIFKNGQMEYLKLNDHI